MILKFSLKFKIFFLLSLIIFMTFFFGISALNYAGKTDISLNKIINEKILIYRDAQEIEIAMANQKGYLTYFFLDGDIVWLEKLGKYREVFTNRIKNINKHLIKTDQKKLIREIEKSYAQYINAKNLVIEDYKNKNSQEITKLHKEQRDMFFEILNMCDKFKQAQWEEIMTLKKELNEKAVLMRKLTAGSVIFLLTTYALMLWVLSSRILEPLKELAIETGGEKERHSKNQIHSISKSLKGIKELYNSTASELLKSRESLEQSERMALVGKLAAGVAHTIRNPFTSIKMRLFSLSRSLELSCTHEEDFQVISDEIARIDNIVQNFLDFSRLPKLKKESCQTYKIIISVIQLLEHRLKTYDVKPRYIKSRYNPVIFADPDRIKEALINLIINACEAMEKGGEIEISEEEKNDSIKIKVKDSGSGIPVQLQNKILNPFFTTKDYGSGLGLSIVEKIAAEHNGTLTFQSEKDKGTTFVLTLPKGEKNDD